MLKNKKSIHVSSWPEYDPKKLESNTVNIAVQVNGKVRGQVQVDRDANEETVLILVRSEKNIEKWILDKQVKKVVYVKNRLINIVILA
jgi:leucyl-tRNA synthetase